MTDLHAHIETASSDCDGLYTSEYVMVYNEDEVAESGKPYNDFSEIRFMNRALTAVASPYAVEFGMTVRIDDDGIEVHENTDEGYRQASVRWCRDDCDTDEHSFRDHTAEAAGY